MMILFDDERHPMLDYAEAILEQALSLSPKDRVSLVEKLLASLDQPDPAIDALWATEADARITAYEAGEIDAIPAEQVFENYKKP
ncbi:MAG: addiction module protein [Gammaproteobacteria bacterium]